MEEKIFRPALHPHTLKLQSSDKLYECHGCKYVGCGLRFGCERCRFNLHKECAHVKQNTTHDFYKNNIFKFFPKPSDHHSKIHCAVCGYSVHGFMYYCEELELYMHPRCHSLPSKFKFYHLEFMLRDRDPVSSVCLMCNQSRLEGTDTFGSWSCVSECNKYKFHVRCATQKYYYTSWILLGNNSEQFFRTLLEKYLGGILKRQRRRKVVMSFVITNLILELVLALLNQVSSSSNKPRCTLFGMLISFAVMLTCILELINEGRTEKLIWSWRNTLPFPWYYYRDGNQGGKPFGTFKDIVGLVCALCQCVDATVSYYYLQQHDDNLIRISFFPIIFAFGILFSQILKNQDAKKPSPKNLIPV